jgi:hypothetical protein
VLRGCLGGCYAHAAAGVGRCTSRPAAKSFLAVRAAADTVPAAAQGHKRMEHAIDILVEEALRPLTVPAQQRRTVRSLLDARFWDMLSERGLDNKSKRRELIRLLTCALP